jgi:hypothetical protein
MFKCVKLFLKKRRVLRNIRSKLPVCTVTGQPIEWNVSLISNNTYDIHTGKIVKRRGLIVNVEQAPPRTSGYRYEFDWHKRLFKIDSSIWRL